MFQESVEVCNAKLNAAVDVIGPQPFLRIFDSETPASCEEDDPSGLLVEMSLPKEWMEPASEGHKLKSVEDWAGEAIGEGTALSFRICSRQGVCGFQGSVSERDGQGDMKLDNTKINQGQRVTIENFALTAGNDHEGDDNGT